jgi:dTDP-D-glucose 4,6-dehydratase
VDIMLMLLKEVLAICGLGLTIRDFIYVSSEEAR